VTSCKPKREQQSNKKISVMKYFRRYWVHYYSGNAPYYYSRGVGSKLGCVTGNNDSFFLAWDKSAPRARALRTAIQPLAARDGVPLGTCPQLVCCCASHCHHRCKQLVCECGESVRLSSVLSIAFLIFWDFFYAETCTITGKHNARQGK
jgi:hypothetical protein